MSEMNGQMDSGRAQRRMRHLLLDRRFQLKYTAMIVCTAALVAGILGAFLFSKVRENSRMLELEGLGNTVFQNQLEASDGGLMMVIILSLSGFLLVVTALSVLITHRIAGPIYVMRRHMMDLARGTIPKIRALRKGDEFVDFYESLAGALDSMEQRTAQEAEILSRAVEALSGVENAQVQAVCKDLGDLLAGKRTMLRPRSGT